MNFDQLGICKHCSSDACYIQEIKNTNVKLEYCFTCGYQTHSHMIEGSEFYKQQLETLPELYKDLIYIIKDTKQAMIPSFVNQESKGMVYAEGGSDNWGWVAIKSKKLTKSEKKNPIYKNSNYRINQKTRKIFENNNFMDALSYIGLIP